MRLLLLGIAVELADQPFAIFSGALGEVVDESFDLISGGLPQAGGAAEVGGIGLHEAGIELVLANQEAEAVAEAGLTVLVTIISVGGRLGRIRRAGAFDLGAQPSSSTEQSPMP